jgi:very-short-patch-repair endonuclease
MLNCQRCGNENDGNYGSGKYCSKKCAFTKNENQLEACRRPKSEETKKKMRKPKSDSSKMGRSDKSGDKNPNSRSVSGKMKDRNNSSYLNLCSSNKRNGLGWNYETRELHSQKMKADSNWMRGKKHSDESIRKIKSTIQEKYKSGNFNTYTRAISKAEREIINYLNDSNVNFISQYTIKGSPLRYDFYFPDKNLIVEYYGDYWHGNPNIYFEESLLGRGSNRYTAEMKWKSDREKENFAINSGYNILIIWESEFNKNKKNILNKLV